MPRPAAGIDTYKRERVLWQSVLQNNKLQIKCDTRAKTIQLIQRLHAFRSLHRRESFSGDVSIFDDYVITNPGKDNIVVIEPRYTMDDLEILTPNVDLQRARDDIQSLDAAKQTNIDKEIEQLEYEQARKHKIDPDKPLDL